MTNLQFRILAAITLGLWILISFFLGNLSLGQLIGFGVPITIAWLIWDTYDNKCWRWKIFSKWLNDTPNVSGGWEGELRSSFVPDGSDKAIEPIKCYALIEQTSTQIDMRLFTTQAQSQTISGKIYRVGLIGHEISINYENKPLAKFRTKSPLHFGTLRVRVNSLMPHCIEGEYWTSRKTTGDLILDRRKSISFSTFDEAQIAFSKEEE